MRRAVVLGSNGPTWDRLKFASDDADRFERILKSECNFAVERIDNKADLKTALAEILSVAAACERDDHLIVYFSGHGEIFRGKLYLLLDNTSQKIFDSALNAHHIIEAIGNSEASHKLIILDCCHAGRVTGYKGKEEFPSDLDQGSELILCASDHIERTRELEELRSGFLTYHICEIIKSGTGEVGVRKLLYELRRRAAAYNQTNKIDKIPIPYLFGVDKTDFLIKTSSISVIRKRSLEPILLRAGLFETDFAEFFESLHPYCKLNISRLETLDINFQFPSFFYDRISTIEAYISSDRWPNEEVNESVKIQALEFSQKFIPIAKERLHKGIRNALSIGVNDEHSALKPRIRWALEGFIQAQMIALGRVLSAFWFKKEKGPDWFPHNADLDIVWSYDLWSGITIYAERFGRWLFWTESEISGLRDPARVYVPQTLEKNGNMLPIYDEEIFARLIYSQLMDRTIIELQDFPIHADLVNYYSSRIYSRDGPFIETESHNSPDGNLGTRRRIARIIGEELARVLSTEPDRVRKARRISVANSQILPPGEMQEVFRTLPQLKWLFD